MKKILIALLVFIVLIFTALIISPVLFEDDIKTKFKDLVNEQVNASIEFNDIDLSFIRNFPKASIKIEEFKIINTEVFNGSKLADIKGVELKMDIMGLINSIRNNSQINIQSIIIEDPEINLMILKNGLSNWDIAISESDTINNNNEESDIFKIFL